MSVRFLNISLRGVTIGLKFLLSIVVIKMLNIEDFGILGLFQSTIIIFSFIIGVDFYAFSSREIIKLGEKEVNFYIKNQLFFHLIIYLIFIPITYLIFEIGKFDFKYSSLFYFILITEHMSQELYRILIILRKTLPATILLFIRSGLWIIALYIVWKFNFVDPTIYSLLVLWLLGAILSLIFGFKYINLKWTKGIDVGWIMKGIKIAFPFFVGTILYKLIEFSGRYFLSYYFTTTEVGVFTFFSGIANVLFVFVQTIVIIELYPKLLESKHKSVKEFQITLQLFKKQIIQFTLVGLFFSIIMIYPLLFFLDKEILFENIVSYIILLISTIVFCFSFIFHYALYTYNYDMSILKATAISFLSNLVFSFLLIPNYGIIGAAIAQLFAFLVMYLVKFIYWKKLS